MNRGRPVVWLTVWALVVSPLLQGGTRLDPEYLIDSWETEDGLPENSATAMVQTPDGYLWFGTFNGLVRFDGVRFTVLDPSNTPGMPSPAVVNLHLDAAHRLWVSTYRGVVVSDPGRYTAFRKVPGWTGDFVRTFSEGGGRLCATSFDGRVFQVRDERLEALPEPPGASGVGYLGHVDRAGRLWVVQQKSGYVGHWDGERWQPSPAAAEVCAGFVGWTGDRDGRLLVVTQTGLLRLEAGAVVSRVRLQSRQEIPGSWSVHEDHEGTVWVSSQGLYRIRPGGETRHFTATNALTYDSLRFSFEDREHNLWVGTSGGGLLRFKPRAFMTYAEAEGLTERNVKAVLEEAPGRILAGTYRAGLFAWTGDRVTRLGSERQPDSPWVQCLLRDREGSVWVGGYAGMPEVSALSRWTRDGRRDVPAAVGGRSVQALFQDGRGRIWIGGSSNVTLYDGGRFRAQTLPDGLGLEEVRCFAEDVSQGILWAASGKALYQFTANEWREVRGPNGLPVEDVLCLRVGPEGVLWLGGGAGLRRFHRDRWTVVTEAQGLPSRDISCILEDDLGSWWLGSNRGVIRTSPSDLSRVADGAQGRLTCQVFTLSDGLATVECTMGMQSTALKDSAGRLWFATLKGLAMVDPRRLRLNTNPPPVVIEGLRVEDAQGRQRYLPNVHGGPIPVAPDTREVAVFLAGLSFVAPEKMEFAYRLEGMDRSWRDLGRRRTIYLYKPAPGTYRLHARAANNDGLWNEVGASVAFTVQPFWWQALWFRVGALLGFGGAIGVGVATLQRHRLRLAEERLEQQRALAEERARSAALTQHATDIITLLDPGGRILYESPSASRILGYAPGVLLGKDPLEWVHPEDRPLLSQALASVIRKTNPGIPTAFRFRHAQGHWIPLEALGTNLVDQPGVQGILITSRDITERKRVDEALHRSLEEKTALLKEVHHRVKNNLQIVVSLLNLQAVRTSDPAVLGTLKDTQNRVRSMALLHETLYRIGDLARINLAGYVEDLCTHLRRSFGTAAARIRIETRVAAVALNLDQAVPCGLIINELVSNALKHAFPADREGRIVVELTAGDGPRVVLRVTDNGVGLPPDGASGASGTLGLQLVQALAQQLGGNAVFDPGAGTTCRVTFEAADAPVPKAPL